MEAELTDDPVPHYQITVYVGKNQLYWRNNCIPIFMVLLFKYPRYGINPSICQEIVAYKYNK